MVKMLQKGVFGPRMLMVRTSFVTAVVSALLTNDAAVLVLTEPILEMASSFGCPAAPFAMALATSANMGSAATLIGNPQNVLIAGYSGIGFMRYLYLSLLPVSPRASS